MNDLFSQETNFPKGFKPNVFYNKHTIFSYQLINKLYVSLLNERFFRKYCLKTIIFILNERFYLTIVQWQNERSGSKMNDNFENERNSFIFEQLKKN